MSAVSTTISPEIFREYDIRGVAGRDLTDESTRRLGRALGSYFLSHNIKRVVIGRDNRTSSPMMRNALVDGLTSTGCNVVDIGIVVTPVFYYACILYEAEGGAMITASHNPPEFNGLKIMRGPSTIYGEEIQKIRRLAEKESAMYPRSEEDPTRSETFETIGTSEAGKDHPGGEGLATGKSPTPTAKGQVSFGDPKKAYIDMISNKIKLGPRRLKVAVDCGNGTASYFAPEILEHLGCEVIPLYCESNPNFPNHFPDPVKPENLQDLIRLVREKGADVGLSYDGDADRLGVVDEKGNIIWGDMLMILFWREILPKNPGAIAIIEVKCSQALVEEVERLGGRPMFYKTGHSLVKAKMREVGAVFTGEMSGHMFFKDEYYGYDDAIYASARLLRILSNTNKSLSELLADVPHYPATPETRVHCPDREKFKVVEALREHFRSRYPVIDIDGARVLFPSGWGLVRASNTGPELVLRCEAKTPDALEDIKREMEAALADFPAVDEVRWG